MDNFRSAITEGENVLEKLVRKIPGFEGYKNREQARTADQIQRKFMARSLSDHKAKLSDTGQEMLREGKIQFITDVDRVSNIMDKVMEKIEHAVYGYSGFFDAVKIDETKLNMIYEYDLSMINEISAVGEAIDALQYSLGMEDGDPKARIRDVEKAIKSLDTKVSDRKKVLMGVE